MSVPFSSQQISLYIVLLISLSQWMQLLFCWMQQSAYCYIVSVLLNVRTTKSAWGRQFSKQRHLRSQQFHVTSVILAKSLSLLLHRLCRKLRHNAFITKMYNSNKIFVLALDAYISYPRVLYSDYNQMFAIIGVLLIIHTLQSSPADFDQIVSQVLPPLVAKKVIVSHTVNGNQLSLYILTKIPFDTIEDLYSRNAILIDSYMHARESYSVDLMKQLFQQIIKFDSQKLNYFLENGVFIMFPYVNIDGYYQYIKLTPNDRDKIRKNRNNQSKVFCIYPDFIGVDINRNFPYNFGIVPQSSQPCSEQYHGLAPFSEKEAQVFKSLFLNFHILIALDLHSYGNEWIYPYASDSIGTKIKSHSLYPFYEYLIRQFKSMNKLIESCIKSLNYIADGVYIDWALDQGAFSLSYQVGSNFDKDSQIEKSIKSSLEDFFVIFEMAVPSYEVQMLANTIQIKSTSLSAANLIIKLDGIQRNQTLPSGRIIEIQYDLAKLRFLQIKVDNSHIFNKTMSFSKDMAYWPIIVILVLVLVAVLSIIGYQKQLSKGSCIECSKDLKAMNQHSSISTDQVHISSTSCDLQ